MDAAQILGYFIEEAKEHLDTLEQGLATFEQTLTNGERLQELFRAAHSIKGGAAMLDLEAIRYVAAQLEDSMKVVKEHPQIPASSPIGSLLQESCADLRVLLTLVEQNPTPADRDTATEETTLAHAQERLATLHKQLVTLASQPPMAMASPPSSPSPTPARVSAPASPVGKAVQEEGALQLIFRSDVSTQLRQMLQLFKQADSPDSRQQLQDFCAGLERAGEQFDLSAWCYLVRMAKAAIANPQNTYHTLAPIVIKELKQAQDAVLAGTAQVIQASGEFQALVPPDWDTPLVNSDDFDDLLGSLDQVPLDGELDLSFLGDISVESEMIPTEQETDSPSSLEFDQLFNELDVDGVAAEAEPSAVGAGPETERAVVPGVGSEELSNLADLFGGDGASPEATALDADLDLGRDTLGPIDTTASLGPDAGDPSAALGLEDLGLDDLGIAGLEGSDSGASDASSGLGDLDLGLDNEEGDGVDSAFLQLFGEESAEGTDADEGDEIDADFLDNLTGGETPEPAIAETPLTFTDDLGLGNDLGLGDESAPEAARDLDQDFGLDSAVGLGDELGLEPDLDLEADLGLSDDPGSEALELPTMADTVQPEAAVEPEESGLDSLDGFELGEEIGSAVSDISLDGLDPSPSTATEASTLDFDLGTESGADLDLDSELNLEADLDLGADLEVDLGAETDSIDIDADLDAALTDPLAIVAVEEDDIGDSEDNIALNWDDAEEAGPDRAPALDPAPAAPTAKTETTPSTEPGPWDDFGGFFVGDAVERDAGEGSDSATSAPNPPEDVDDFFGALAPDSTPSPTSTSDSASLDFLSSSSSSQVNGDSLELEFGETPTSGAEPSTTDASADDFLANFSVDTPSPTPTPSNDLGDLLQDLEGSSLEADPETEREQPPVEQSSGSPAEAPDRFDLDSLGLDDFGLGDPVPATSLDGANAETERVSLPDTDLGADFDGVDGWGDLDLDPVDPDVAILDAAPAAGIDAGPTGLNEGDPGVTDLGLTDLGRTDSGEDLLDEMSLDDWGTESLGGESTAAIDGETVTDSFTDDWTDDDLNFDALVGLGDELVSAEETDLPSTPAADGLSLDSFDFDLDGDGENMPNATPESSAATDASNLEVDFGTAFGDPALGDTDFNLDDLLGSEGTDQASGTDLDADGGANLDADLDLGAFNPGDLDMDLSLDGLDGLGGLDLMSGSDAPESVTDGSSLDNLDDLDSFLSTPADPSGLTSGGGDIDDLALDLDLGGELGDLDDLLNDAGGDGSSNGNGGPSGLSEAFGLSDLEAFLETPAAQGASMGPGALLDEDLDDGLAEMTRLLQQAEAGVGPLPAVPTVPKRSKTTQKGLQKRQVDQSMRVPVKQLDNLNNLVGEMVVNRNSLETDRDRLRDSLEKLLSQVQQLSDVGQRLQDLYERSLLENALLASRQAFHAPKPAAHLNLSKNGAGAEEDDDFDALEMDRFSGFHLLSQEMIELIVRVRESSSDIEYIVNEPLDYVARNFRQITAQLQEELTRSRMLPFEYTATRIPRAVRTVSQKCGKKAEVVTEGIDVLIDKVLLDQIYDPMTHLVNNAVTHGIESPEERLKVGKPEIGTIRVQAFHQGNQTVISISDDGAGIDTDRVRAKALSKGLITPEEAKTLSDMELHEFLFHPGFSTKDQADDFSGRGVGMDVVRTKISELRGNVTIDSDLGHGTTFTVRLPLTLSISKALCCISSRARVAFPMDGVEDMLDVPRDRVQNNDQGQPCIYWRDQPMPFRPLSELLRYNRASRSTVYGGSQDEDMLSVVILRSASEYMALQVDRVDGEKEIVIKQLEGPVPKPTGIAGVTVLADGTVMPIADVLELIDIAKGRTRQSTTALWQEDGPTDVIPEADVPHEPMVLIVDDSIVVRELLSMSFRKFNYRVEQARDGQEAWEKLRSGLPCDIIFCDIEMPRMTGLELLEKLQGDDHLNQIPMAMLTSRGATKHREMALKLGARGYFTKPYLEEALLEAASRMLKGEVLLNASTAA